MKIFILISFFAFACTSLQRQEGLSDLKKRDGIKIRTLPVKSEGEAKSIIQSQINFLTLLFQQSQDPYYGTFKWEPDCLEKNKVGKVTNEGNSVQAISELYLDSQGNAGHCPHITHAVKSHKIFLYCKGNSNVLEVIYPVSDLEKIPEKIICN